MPRINLAGRPREIRDLLADLRHDDWSVRRQAARGLLAAVRQEKIPAAKAIKALRAAVAHPSGLIAVCALATLAPLEWVPELHTRLLGTLREAGPASHKRTTESDARWAAEVLARSGSEELVRSICETATALAADGDPRFVQAAVDVLHGLLLGGARIALRPLEVLSHHEKKLVQDAAKHALANPEHRIRLP